MADPAALEPSDHGPLPAPGRAAIWAPWRIEYIRSEKEATGCILCRAAGAPEDRAALVLLRGKSAFALLNRYPYNSGHLMVSPYRHVPELDALADDELTDLMRMVQRCVAILRRLMKPEGFNIGMNLGRAAGAGIEDHVHVHIVPRWIGDTNCMPVLADTRVVPQALLDTWAELKRAATEP